VEEIHGDHGRLGVVAEDIGVVAGGGGHLLALGHFFHGVQQIAQGGGLFEAHIGRCASICSRNSPRACVAAFEQQTHLAHGL
jgi:hypothetical protein